MDSKTRVKLDDVTKKKAFVEDPEKGLIQKIISDPVAAEESIVKVRDNELIQGILDKNQIGNAEYSLVHAFYELYGGSMTETLLTCLTRVLLIYLQFYGETCAIDDLKMSLDYDKERRELIESALREGVHAAANFAGVDKPKIKDSLDLNNRPWYHVNDDGKYHSKSHKKTADVDYIS